MKIIPNQLRIDELPRLDQHDECVGCGEVKKYRGKPASSLIACNSCFKSLPKWMRDAFMLDHTRPTLGSPVGATVWQNRIGVFLAWKNETSK